MKFQVPLMEKRSLVVLVENTCSLIINAHLLFLFFFNLQTVEAPAKSSKLRSKHTNPGSKTSFQERSSAFINVTNQEGPSAVHCSTVLEGDTGLLVPPKQANSADETQAQQSPKNGEARKEEENKPNLQKGDGSDKEGEKVSRVTRSGVGKVMKGIVGGSVAVHVAS